MNSLSRVSIDSIAKGCAVSAAESVLLFQIWVPLHLCPAVEGGVTMLQFVQAALAVQSMSILAHPVDTHGAVCDTQFIRVLCN